MSRNPADPTPTKKRRRWRIAALIALALSPLIVIIGILAGFWIAGIPILDDWSCGDGEAPYSTADGGSACAPEGSTLAPGEEWDPFGNRPYECSRRWGWVEVVPDSPPAEGLPTSECVRKGDPIPEGWHKS